MSLVYIDHGKRQTVNISNLCSNNTVLQVIPMVEYYSFTMDQWGDILACNQLLQLCTNRTRLCGPCIAAIGGDYSDQAVRAVHSCNSW